MRLRPYLLLAVACVLTTPAPAAAVSLTTTQTAQYQTWADESLVPQPPGQVRLEFTGCASIAGEPPVTVYWSCSTDRGLISMAPDDHHNQSVFLHELGHIFDFRVMRPRYRRVFLRWFGGGYWEPQPDPRVLGMGREVFASAYSLCARYRVLPDLFEFRYETQYGWSPSQEQHDRACWLIRRAAAAARNDERPRG